MLGAVRVRRPRTKTGTRGRKRQADMLAAEREADRQYEAATFFRPIVVAYGGW